MMYINDPKHYKHALRKHFDLLDTTAVSRDL